jgi:two-component system sensor histidine kinase BaeS
MTIYPVRRSLHSILWFVTGVLFVLVLGLAAYSLTFQPRAYDRWLITLGMGGMALLALLAGLTAYGLHWIQRVPKLRSTVFAGYVLAGLIVCLTVGWLAGALFVDAYDRTVLLILLLFAAGLALALGYLHAGMISARLESLVGAADALRLGHFHARVEIDGHDQLAQLGAIFNDMAAKLEATERKERHLNRMRRELQGWVGNDLRIPVSRALSTVDALTSGALDNPDTYLRFLRSAQRNIHILSDLVDDLYDITQLDVSALAISRQPTNAEQLVAAMVKSLARAAQDKGIVLTGTATPGLPIIDVDPHQVGRALSNLVTHALHRTPSGGVVKVNAYPTRQGVLFEVVDYYEGERPEDMAQLLRLFLDESDVRRSDESIPLGMAMANAIVQAHGGAIRSERMGNKGLRLVFKLTVDESSGTQTPRGM